MTGMTPSEEERKGRKVGRKGLRLTYRLRKFSKAIRGPTVSQEWASLVSTPLSAGCEQPMEACCWQEVLVDFRSQQLGP